MPDKAKKLLADFEVKRTPAEWAFRWLWNQPEVTCVLSRMNSLEMVQENVKNAANSRVGEFGEKEEKLLKEVVQILNDKMKVGCTGCSYCMPCPQKVDIPGTFAAYNRRFVDGKMAATSEYIMCTLLRKDAISSSNCVECGLCEKHCPQHIEIRKELKNAGKELEGPLYKVAKKVVPLVIKY